MNNSVQSNRNIYIPSEFAKKSLIYLQEVGTSKTNKLNTNSRSKLDSFLFFIVLDGTGSISFNNKTYKLSKESCVFIDCNNKYSHTSDNWTIKWVHFNGLNSKELYKKYLDRKGLNIFKTKQFNKYESILDEIQLISNSSDYLKDMNIHEKITSLLSLLLSETLYEKNSTNNQIYDIKVIKEYIDNNYLTNISLDKLSKKYYINKFYLTRLFKNTYGVTINNYINNKKITKAKELLRFSDLSINNISKECGFIDNNYFSRVFKQIESIAPKEYRDKW